MERLIAVLADPVRVLCERTRVNLMDVKGVGKPSVFQNDEPKVYEWARKIEDCLTDLEPHLEVMLDWVLESEIESRQGMIADRCGEHGDPTEQVDGFAQAVVQLKTVLAHLTEGERWSIMQSFGRNGLAAWRGRHKRFDPLTGRRRNLLRAIVTPQRVKMEDLGSIQQEER